jgi:uncharacterized protein (DUF433 family)
MKYGPISMEGGVSKAVAFFAGTDVPVKAFFEYLEDDKSVAEFLNDYPAVNKKDVLKLLEMAKSVLTDEQILKDNFTAT